MQTNIPSKIPGPSTFAPQAQAAESSAPVAARPTADTFLRDVAVGGAAGAVYGGLFPMSVGLGLYAMSPGAFFMAPPLLIISGARDSLAAKSPLPLLVNTACAATLIPAGLIARTTGLAMVITSPLTTPFTTALGTMIGMGAGALFGPQIAAAFNEGKA